MPLLTARLIQEIKEIIRKHHTAFVANAFGKDVLPPEAVEKLRAAGLISQTQGSSLDDAYLYGQVMAQVEKPEVAEWSAAQVRSYAAQNPVPLTQVEREAVKTARLTGAEYCQGLGNVIEKQTGQLLIEADHALREDLQGKIADATAVNIAARGTVKALKTDLGWATQDWARNLDRIAITEKQNAMQQGVADGIRKRVGEEARVSIRCMPDACGACRAFSIGPDGAPRIYRLSQLGPPGSNVHRKQNAWVACVGAVHPHCHPAGTVVQTRRGRIPIETVVPGDMVLTHRGRWMPVSHTWASRYSGIMLRVRTESAVVDVTPEHPLFRSNGTTASAQNLQQGDNLLDLRLDGEPAPSVQGDADHGPSAPLERAHLARILFGLSPAGVPVAAVNFHGELFLWEGNVHQKRAHNEAWEPSHSDGAKRLMDEAFTGTFELTALGLKHLEDVPTGVPFATSGCMRSVGAGTTFLRAGPGVAEALGFPHPADDVSSTLQAEHHGPTGHPQPPGNLLYREQLVEVQVYKDRFINFAPVHHEPSVAFSAPTVRQAASIVNVSSNQFDGLVFNLTVPEDHSYTANGLASHNCQCQLVRLPVGWGYNAEGEMEPGGRFGVEVPEDEEEAEKAFRMEVEHREAMQKGGTLDFQGMPIRIEQDAGEVRHWRDRHGESGSTTMQHAYGEIVGTKGADGDPVDVFLGMNPNASHVYVVHQRKKRADGTFGGFDEDKAFLGFSSPEEAKAAYLLHYDNPEFFGGMSAVGLEDFRARVGAPGPLVGEPVHTPELTFTVALPESAADMAKAAVRPPAVPDMTFTLGKAFGQAAAGHKYIRRTYTKGHWVYEYAEQHGGHVSSHATDPDKVMLKVEPHHANALAALAEMHGIHPELVHGSTHVMLPLTHAQADSIHHGETGTPIPAAMLPTPALATVLPFPTPAQVAPVAPAPLAPTVAPAPAQVAPRARPAPAQQMGLFDTMPAAQAVTQSPVTHPAPTPLAVAAIPEKKWGVVGSTAFRNWFGDWTVGQGSKVVNADNTPAEQHGAKPATMFHGTAVGGFTEFRKDKDKGTNIFGHGFYFTADKGIAKSYTEKDANEAKAAATGFLDKEGEPITHLTKKQAAELAEKAAGNANPNWDYNILHAVKAAAEPDGRVNVATLLKEFWNPTGVETDGGYKQPKREVMPMGGVRLVGGIQGLFGKNRAGEYHVKPVIPESQVFEVYLNIRNPVDMDKAMTRADFAEYAAFTHRRALERLNKELEQDKARVETKRGEMASAKVKLAALAPTPPQPTEMRVPEGKRKAVPMPVEEWTGEMRRAIDDPTHGQHAMAQAFASWEHAKNEREFLSQAAAGEGYDGFNNAVAHSVRTQARIDAVRREVPGEFLHGVQMDDVAPREHRLSDQSESAASYDDFVAVKRSIKGDRTKPEMVTYGGTSRARAGILYVGEQKPGAITWGEMHWLMSNGHEASSPRADFDEWARATGKDGVHHTGGWNIGTHAHDVWIAFEPNQIKSSTANTTFDPASNDMEKAGPYVGPHGGLWADPKHTIHWSAVPHWAQKMAASHAAEIKPHPTDPHSLEVAVPVKHAPELGYQQGQHAVPHNVKLSADLKQATLQVPALPVAPDVQALGRPDVQTPAPAPTPPPAPVAPPPPPAPLAGVAPTGKPKRKGITVAQLDMFAPAPAATAPVAPVVQAPATPATVPPAPGLDRPPANPPSPAPDPAQAHQPPKESEPGWDRMPDPVPEAAPAEPMWEPDTRKPTLTQAGLDTMVRTAVGLDAPAARALMVFSTSDDPHLSVVATRISMGTKGMTTSFGTDYDKPEALGALVAQGLVEPAHEKRGATDYQQWRLTPAGKAARAAVEAERQRMTAAQVAATTPVRPPQAPEGPGDRRLPKAPAGPVAAPDITRMTVDPKAKGPPGMTPFGIAAADALAVKQGQPPPSAGFDPQAAFAEAERMRTAPATVPEPAPAPVKPQPGQPGAHVKVTVNQGQRPAKILARLGDNVLLEYTMPAGTTGLLVMDAAPDGSLKPSKADAPSYRTCPKKWLQAIQAAGQEWDGTAQRGNVSFTDALDRAGLTPKKGPDGWDRMPEGRITSQSQLDPNKRYSGWTMIEAGTKAAPETRWVIQRTMPGTAFLGEGGNAFLVRDTPMEHGYVALFPEGMDPNKPRAAAQAPAQAAPAPAPTPPPPPAPEPPPEPTQAVPEAPPEVPAAMAPSPTRTEAENKQRAMAVGAHIAGSKKDQADLRNKVAAGRLDEVSYADAAKFLKKESLMPVMDEAHFESLGATPGAAHMGLALAALVGAKPPDSDAGRKAYIEGVRLVAGGIAKLRTVADADGFRQEVLDMANNAGRHVRPMTAEEQALLASFHHPDRPYEARLRMNRYLIEQAAPGEAIRSMRQKDDGPLEVYWLDRSEMESVHDVFRALGPRFIAGLDLPIGTRGEFGSRKRAMFDRDTQYGKAKAVALKADAVGWDAWKAAQAAVSKDPGAGKSKEKSAIRTRWEKSPSGTVTIVGAKKMVDVGDPERLKAVLGAAGIQRGESLTGGQGASDFAHHVKHMEVAAYDLADILGVEPKTLSLSGRLAVAIAARGSGKALAHFEANARDADGNPIKAINITRHAGAGSVAHEWGHFMDNVMAEAHGGANTSSTGAYASEGAGLSGMGSEVATAFRGVREALNKPDWDSRMKNARERTSKMAELKGRSEDINRELAALYKTAPAKDGVPDAAREKRKQRLLSEHDAVREEFDVVKRIDPDKSDYANHASVLDDHKQGKYFTRGREMFSRAFEAWVQDKLEADQGGQRRNTYLVDSTKGVQFTNHHMPDGSSAQPYPQGEERTRIGAAFENLFAALRNTGALAKAMRAMQFTIMPDATLRKNGLLNDPASQAAGVSSAVGGVVVESDRGPGRGPGASMQTASTPGSHDRPIGSPTDVAGVREFLLTGQPRTSIIRRDPHVYEFDADNIDWVRPINLEEGVMATSHDSLQAIERDNVERQTLQTTLVPRNTVNPGWAWDSGKYPDANEQDPVQTGKPEPTARPQAPKKKPTSRY
jgi:hypothetical protein